MKLRDAVLLARSTAYKAGPAKILHLTCGFSPLHLSTFLLARLSQRFPDHKWDIQVGQYGDLIEACHTSSEVEAMLVVIEYADLDPRLGLRRLSGWKRDALQDTVSTTEGRLLRLYEQIKATRSPRIVVMPPTLPLPPIFSTGSSQISPLELLLRNLVSNFLAQVSLLHNVVVCKLDRSTAGTSRRDVGMEFTADFPYKVDHASGVAAGLIEAAFPPAPLKGIITDLDDTLWRGLVGEVGPEGIHWSLDGNSQIHALYQQLLNSLGEQGILIGVASKNEKDVVSKALARSDILLDQTFVYPVEAHWQAKSFSVARILEIWNVLPDSVVYIDDNPMELEEVRTRFPTIRTFQFPGNVSDAFAMLSEIRDLVHKESISAEDLIRMESIRNAGAMVEEGRTVSPEDFLKGLGSKLLLSQDVSGEDNRALELVNKTNQFNINGIRFDVSDWKRRHIVTGAFTLIAEYTDKFGPLGKIGVLFGRIEEDCCIIDGWVVSCRAFSRRIEHAMLMAAINMFAAKSIRINFRETEKNKPVRDFLLSFDSPLIDGELVECSCVLGAMPQVYSSIKIAQNSL